MKRKNDTRDRTCMGWMGKPWMLMWCVVLLQSYCLGLLEKFELLVTVVVVCCVWVAPVTM